MLSKLYLVNFAERPFPKLLFDNETLLKIQLFGIAAVKRADELFALWKLKGNCTSNIRVIRSLKDAAYGRTRLCRRSWRLWSSERSPLSVTERGFGKKLRRRSRSYSYTVQMRGKRTLEFRLGHDYQISHEILRTLSYQL